MTHETPTREAYDLGMDHADADHNGMLERRLHSGRDVARALGFEATIGEQLVDLREAYNDGWRDWA